MIALPGFMDRRQEAMAEARIRVGGRALVVSDYASRMVKAIDELVEISQNHCFLADELREKEIRKITELDGRIEALRIRLGIPSLPLPERDGRTIGFTRFAVIRHKWNSEPEEKLHADNDTDWYDRMASMKAMARELAIAPQLDADEQDIVGLIVEARHRMTTTQILDEFARGNVPKGDSTIKGKLAQLTKRGVLVNRSDTNPKGYGLPEWDAV